MEILENTTKVTLSSGRIVTIRETNGEDDAILSKIGAATNNGENIYNFLANIMVDEPRILAKDIMDWPVNDRYGLLFKQRIINLGTDFSFKHTDPTDLKKREVEYTEDLSSIDGDMADPNFTRGPNTIFKYPKGNALEVEYTSSSKRKFRYKILTGVLELAALDTPQADTNKNSMLTNRHIEIFKGSKWERLYNFREIPSKEMAEIRADVTRNDSIFSPMVSFTNPYTNNPFSIDLFAFPTFYFPEGTM